MDDTGFSSHQGHHLNILHLEDNSWDTDLIALELHSQGISCKITQVWSRDAFESALQKRKIDVIFSDSSVPGFDTSNALKFVRHDYPKIPFIFVSGNTNPQLKTDALAHGATDYIDKGNLPQLARVVERVGFWNREKYQKKKPPEIGVPVIAQCKGFRCLGYLDANGNWRDWKDSKELSDVIDWFGL
jgi:CheY-like chemotaxis protein